MITNSEAEQRGRGYDARGSTYLFDLDFADECSYEEGTCYTVDAGAFGNIAHFVNHSVSGLAAWVLGHLGLLWNPCCCSVTPI